MEILLRTSESCIVLLKINSNDYPLKSTNYHYLLLNTTIIPLCNSKTSLIFLLRVVSVKNELL